MPDLLLAHGYFVYDDPKELQIMKLYAPLGILRLCSHLRYAPALISESWFPVISRTLGTKTPKADRNSLPD